MNRVQLVIAVDSDAVGAAPCHVSREVAIADGGVALVPSLLKLVTNAATAVSASSCTSTLVRVGRLLSLDAEFDMLFLSINGLCNSQRA